MASKLRRLKENVEGNFYVDSTCVNCGVSRHYAPSVFGDSGTHAFVKKQPQSHEELLATKQALLACPAASIGTIDKTELESAKQSFPLEMTQNIFLTGFNSRKSYGAHSYFIKAESGNWLIDSPRYTKHLVKKFTDLGGIKYIFLSHSDDVADAHKYAKHFSAKRIIHKLEQHAQKDAEIILEGESENIIDQAKIIFTPGHTHGHLVMLWRDRYLFSGDHIAWLPRINRLGSFNDYCWHSWQEQIRSVEKLEALKNVEWVFPGHGKWKQIPQGEFPTMIATAVDWMKTL